MDNMDKKKQEETITKKCSRDTVLTAIVNAAVTIKAQTAKVVCTLWNKVLLLDNWIVIITTTTTQIKELQSSAKWCAGSMAQNTKCHW